MWCALMTSHHFSTLINKVTVTPNLPLSFIIFPHISLHKNEVFHQGFLQ